MSTIRQRLEEAEVALRSATVESLNQKQDQFVPDILDALNAVRDVISNFPIRITDNTELWRHKLDSGFQVTSIGTDLTNNYASDQGYAVNFDLDSSIDLNTGEFKTGDVVTFPTPTGDVNLTFNTEEED
tara:strand:+ start:2431 stop:2817 length:387 start_codon:yes stop_codon:yes gene_type:complete